MSRDSPLVQIKIKNNLDNYFGDLTIVVPAFPFDILCDRPLLHFCVGMCSGFLRALCGGSSGTPSNPSGEPLQRSIRKAQTNEILFERKVLILRSVDSEIALRGHP